MFLYLRRKEVVIMVFAFFLVFFFLLAAVPAGRTSPLQAETANDELVEARAFGVNTLDPALAYDFSSLHAVQQIYEPLLLLDQKTGEQFQQLASSWSYSGAQNIYEFNIRQGIAFQSGGQLTTEDVAYSIQRGLLQSDPNSPQWFLIQALMGYDSGDITQEITGGPYHGDRDALIANASPAELRAVCEKVKLAVKGYPSQNTVAFKLAVDDTSFLNKIATYGMILDREWAITQGDWNGDCGTWQNYYAPGENSALKAVTNGTGPFKLHSWQPGSELILVRNDGYWRSTPLWPGGPAGPAALSKITLKVVPDGAQRKAMLLSGEADIADIFTDDQADLDSQVRLEQQGDNLELKNKDGVLIATSGLPVAVASGDGFFTFNIETSGPRNYSGSGQLDGNGIPPDFFSDIHVRRAFNHAFDWQTFRDTTYNGKAIRRTGPIIAELMGYSASQPTYAYDPVKAKQEFSQAWGGEVASKGFRMTIAYNTGNTRREAAALQLKSDIESLDPKYKVDVLGIPWSELLSEAGEGRIPIFFMGWAQDYAHPQNWVEPYLFGGFANRQRLPGVMQDQYRTMSQTCLSKTGASARICYEEIQVDAYDKAIDLFLLQSTESRYARAELRGFVESLRYFDSPYIYALSKGEVASIDPIATDTATHVTVAAGNGSSAAITVPAGAVSATADLVTVPTVDVRGKQTAGFATNDAGFIMMVFDGSGAQLPDGGLAAPIEINIALTQPLKLGSHHEKGLLLVWQNGRWKDAACGPYLYDPQGKGFTVPVCVTGQFVVGEVQYFGYLPIIIAR